MAFNSLFNTFSDIFLLKIVERFLKHIRTILIDVKYINLRQILQLVDVDVN